MKIGDEVHVHGYVDEIRKGVVIIRNDGGYFGTVESEVIVAEQTEPQTDWKDDLWTEAVIEPQTDCDDRYALRTDSGEVVAYACPLSCEQTDCPWK